MNNENTELVVGKRKEFRTHLGCMVVHEAVYDSRTGLIMQNITLSTPEDIQARDAADAHAVALGQYGLFARRRS